MADFTSKMCIGHRGILLTCSIYNQKQHIIVHACGRKSEKEQEPMHWGSVKSSTEDTPRVMSKYGDVCIWDHRVNHVPLTYFPRAAAGFFV